MTKGDNPVDKSSRRSIRLKWYDYSSPGYYFVTICRNRKKPFFGHIEDTSVLLSGTGWVAHECFIDISNHLPEVVIDQYIVMPNHVHGILYIGPVGAPHVVPELPQLNAFSRTIPNSLSMVVQQYKSSLKR
jgi:hypothetical protein